MIGLLRQASLIPIVLFLYWAYGWRPIQLRLWLMVDDGLYIRHAEAFLNWVRGTGDAWLGAYDWALLVKAPLYGIWLALVSWVGLPLRIAEFLLLISTAFLFKKAVRPLWPLIHWQFVVVLCLLTALPFLPSETFLVRNQLHSALTSLCLISTLGMILRNHASLAVRLRWGGATGFFFSLCYLNREEASWLIATLVLALALITFVAIRVGRRAEKRWHLCFVEPALIALALVLAALPSIGFTCFLNHKYYGVFTTTLRRGAAFTAAYQRLTSLEPALHQRYVPIQRATRLKAYDLSPTFARLKPFLEGKGGHWTAGNGDHSIFNGRKVADKEFFVSNFEFSLRFAADQAGAKTAAKSEAMFAAIDRELAQAIRAGRIVAGRHGPATLAAPTPGDLRRIVLAWCEAWYNLLVIKDLGVGWSSPAKIPEAGLERIARLVNSPIVAYPPESASFELRTYAFAKTRILLKIAYVGSLIVFLVLCFVVRRFARSGTGSSLRLALFAAVIPVSALLAFCLSMAVVEVLGFRFLETMGYLTLGYSALSVHCAFAFVCVLVLVQHATRQGDGARGDGHRDQGIKCHSSGDVASPEAPQGLTFGWLPAAWRRLATRIGGWLLHRSRR
jgi:hypothetical protein